MTTAATTTAHAAASGAPRISNNHLATTILVTLYLALLLTAITLSLTVLRAPASESQPPSGAPSLGSGAGHLLSAIPAHPGSHALTNSTSEPTQPSWAASDTREEDGPHDDGPA